MPSLQRHPLLTSPHPSPFPAAAAQQRKINKKEKKKSSHVGNDIQLKVIDHDIFRLNIDAHPDIFMQSERKCFVKVQVKYATSK